jgi:uncharacterized coiled-coil protein SlyX
MLRVFPEKKRAGDSEAESAPASAPAESGAAHRLAQGFEILFGGALREQRAAAERFEAEIRQRLDALEHRSAGQGEALEQLGDKVRATLEREADEARRRKGAEEELRKRVGELREFVAGAIAELHEKANAIETRLREQIQAQHVAERESETEHQQRLLERLERALAEVQAHKVDRQEVAAVLSTLARKLGEGGGSPV